MEKFLGILFCGGKGTRLGEITKYISKSFIPIYDKPVFKYGLEMLEESNFVDEIIILTNNENDEKLKQTGYKTIIQNDSIVFDMFSGWEYIKKITGTKKNGVLVPSDNVSDIEIDRLVEEFNNSNPDILFSLFKVEDKEKLKQMGCYNIEKQKFYYKLKIPTTEFGVIAPYIIKNNIKVGEGDKILNNYNSNYYLHEGFWFDIGDFDSIIKANLYLKKFNIHTPK